MTIGELIREDTGTGSTLRVTDIAAEIERLDGAASDGRWVAVDPHASERCGVDGCRSIHTSALIAPTAQELGEVDRDGMPLTPIAAQLEWPVWLGEVHHADKEWAEVRADLQAWPDQYAPTAEDTFWDDELRALCEPIPISDTYLDSEARTLAMLVAGQSDAGVYAELAPERIHVAVTTIGGGGGRGADDRVERMIADPDSYFTDARARARREVLSEMADGVRRDETSSESEPDGWVRATWWRRALAWVSGRRS